MKKKRFLGTLQMNWVHFVLQNGHKPLRIKMEYSIEGQQEEDFSKMGHTVSLTGLGVT